MIDRLVADANAVVALIRNNKAEPPPLRNAKEVLLPLPVVGELFAGAHYSNRVAENLAKVEEIVAKWSILSPDFSTARLYGRLSGSAGRAPRITVARMNDLWIAALCIQHSLPLLTNDRGFDVIPDLIVMHW
jgi:tRNA(fMet)-specific endonuclease VapC